MRQLKGAAAESPVIGELAALRESAAYLGKLSRSGILNTEAGWAPHDVA